VVLEGLRQLNEALRGREHVPAERGQRRPPGGPVEQPLPEVLLQRGDAAAGHGLRHSGGGRAEREAAALADMDEHPAGGQQVHARSVCRNSM
jgi:hypothetical protein